MEQPKINQSKEDIFIISHTFQADIKAVFDKWINPDDFTGFMGPAGANMTFTKVNIKEGATSQWAMTTDDGLTKYGQISYKIINPVHLLVYRQNFCDEKGNFCKAPFLDTYPDYLLTSVSFVRENDNKTKVTMKWEIFGDASEIERQTFIEMKPHMLKGWTDSFVKLEKLLK